MGLQRQVRAGVAPRGPGALAQPRPVGPRWTRALRPSVACGAVRTPTGPPICYDGRVMWWDDRKE